MPVAGLDTRKALDSSHAKVSLLPAASKLAQRIKAEGLMSFTTQVCMCVYVCKKNTYMCVFVCVNAEDQGGGPHVLHHKCVNVYVYKKIHMRVCVCVCVCVCV